MTHKLKFNMKGFEHRVEVMSDNISRFSYAFKELHKEEE